VKLAEARRIIWARLAVTAREDGQNVDWYAEGPNVDPDDPESTGYDEPSVRRLRRASIQVAETIERRIAKSARFTSPTGSKP
jgi:hypothetical protein